MVRTDIPLADQLVQACHACLLAASRSERNPGDCHLVVLAAASERDLHAALAHFKLVGVEYSCFFEPDRDIGYSAACTQPVPNEHRRFFRRFPLWRPDSTSSGARSPPGVEAD